MNIIADYLLTIGVIFIIVRQFVIEIRKSKKRKQRIKDLKREIRELRKNK